MNGFASLVEDRESGSSFSISWHPACQPHGGQVGPSPCDAPAALRCGSLPGASTRWPVPIWQQETGSWVEAHLDSMQPHSVAAPGLRCRNKALGYGSPFYANAMLLEVSVPAKCACSLTLCATLNTEIVRSFWFNWLTLRNHQFKTHFRQSYWNVLCTDMAVYLNYKSPQKVLKTSLIIF